MDAPYERKNEKRPEKKRKQSHKKLHNVKRRFHASYHKRPANTKVVSYLPAAA